MKNLSIYLSLFLVMVSMSIFAQPTTSNGTIREAATKGKADFLRILSDNKDFNFGLNASDLDGTETGNTIEEFTANFNSLLSSQTQNLGSISTRNERFVVPLTKGSTVVTTVSVASNNKETKAVEFVNQQYTSELNQLPRAVKASNFKGLRIVHVPNLDAVLYISDDKCYTSYNGRNVSEATNVSELVSQLQIDAREFQVKYGEQLKRGKLVR